MMCFYHATVILVPFASFFPTTAQLNIDVLSSTRWNYLWKSISFGSRGFKLREFTEQLKNKHSIAQILVIVLDGLKDFYLQVMRAL